LDSKIYPVVPTKVGTQQKRHGVGSCIQRARRWVPTFVGMTIKFCGFFAFVFFTTYAHAEVLIGVAGPMTGASAQFGAQMVAGVKAAVDDLNAKGGIGGEFVGVVTADDGCDSKLAETAAQDLIAQNVNIVIGHFCSYPSLVAAKLYDAAGLAMIAPSASLPVLTETGLKSIVRLAPRDDAQGAFGARRMQQDFPAAQIAIISDGTVPNEALKTAFLAALKGQPALSTLVTPDSQNVGGLLGDLKTKNITALYCACSASDAGFILQQSRATGLILKLYGPDALLTAQFWEKSGASGEGTHVSFAADPQANLDARPLLHQFGLASVSADGATLPAYAAVQVFAAAAGKSGLGNRDGLVVQLKSGQVFKTVLGEVSFDGKGDVLPQRFVWYVWRNGKYTTE
jgi:branched-chain amino acid transport system substrate-binding protein